MVGRLIKWSVSFGVILFAIPAILIAAQPDLSTTIVICLIFATIMFVGGLSYKVVAGVLAVAIPSAVILITLILQPDQKIFSGERASVAPQRCLRNFWSGTPCVPPDGCSAKK